MDKKGIAVSSLITIILVIAAFVLVAYIIQVIFSFLGPETLEQVCRGAVVARKVFTVPAQERVPANIQTFPLLCTTILKDEVEGDKERVEKELAELAKGCWYEFANGAFPDTLSRVKGQPVCFTCYDVYISEIENNEKITGLELIQWMEENPHKRGSERTYLDYVQFNEEGERRGFLMIPKDLVLEPGQAYAVVYVEPHKPWKWMRNILFSTESRVREEGLSAIYIGERSVVRQEANCVEKLGVEGI